MKILITGVSGGIGNVLANELSKEHEITGIDINYNENLKDINFIKCDITKDKINVNADVVIHLAALADLKKCEDNPELAYNINVNGTKRLLESFKEKKIKKFIYVSTGGVYGFKDEICKEIDEIKPYNVYTKTKYEGELVAKKYNKYFQIVILRLFFPYGAGTNKNKFIYRMKNNIKNDKTIFLNKYGKPIVNPIYISDLIDAFKLIIDSKSEGIFNIGGKEKKRIKEIAEMIGIIVNKKVKFKDNNEKVKNLIGDINEIKKIGFKPKISLKEGLKRI